MPTTATAERLVRLIRDTSSTIPDDVLQAIAAARRRERRGSSAAAVLGTVLENCALAQEKGVPLCQDTGTLTFFVDRALRGRVTPCEKRVMASVEWTIDRYGIDRNRVYLCGNSMGGQAAYAMGLAHGEVFAAVNANVPATVWFAAARLGFVNDDGTDIRDWDASGFAEPPVCVEWSAVDDVWSRDREVIVRNLVKRKWPHLVLWGDYGHCGSVSKARLKNDLVQKFDWLSIRRDAAYPVFTHASCDDRLPWPFKTWKPHTCWFSGWKGDIDRAEMAIAEGTSPVGQINGFFRWRNIRDDGERLEMELRIAPPEELETRHFAPPEAALADVTVRRVQSPVLAAAPRVRWSFGPASGIAVRDAHGALTIPDLGITRAPRNLVLSLPCPRPGPRT